MSLEEVNSKTSESDIYAALMLSRMLDNEQDEASSPPPLKEQDPTTVIWVPADKHPQIAPNEFATFIKTHGMNTPSRRSSSLHRRKSILSQSISRPSEEVQELNRTLSEKKRQFLKKVLDEGIIEENLQTFDRHSAALDDSKIIAPRSDKSLLRRSAFSARGRNRKTFSSEDRQKQRRSVSQRKPSKNDDVTSIKSNKSWDKSKGVSLYDRPVIMSEWIDLGSASLDSDESQRGIISRVQDAESQLRSQLEDSALDTPALSETTKDDTESEKEAISVVETVHEELKETEKEPEAPTPPIVQEERPKRPGIIRSDTESSVPLSVTFARPSKPEKRSSWLGGLFTDKKSTTKNTSHQVTIQSNGSSPLSGISNLFNRSLSLKSNTKQQVTSNKPTTHTTPISTPSTTTTNTTTTITNNNNKNRSSRLEIPPPSERTFFNSNRLPLHVERAIYRLSHMKLTDPRRPLQQQVLISNLMFWYLSIQQQDLQHNIEQRVEANETIPVPEQQKKTTGGKMSRLFKKRRSEVPVVAQFVSPSPPRPPIRQNNVQFSLPEIPSHYHPKTNVQVEDEEEEEEEEDDVPLSYYRN